MQNSFFQAICRVGVFMICAQAITHFRPQEAYEKYLKLLVSLMVLIQLLLPVGSFLLGGGRREATEFLEEFRQEMERGMKEAEESAAAMDAVLEQMTLEEIRRSLEEKSGEESPESEERETQNAGSENREPGSGAGKTGETADTEEILIEVEVVIE